MSTDADEKQIIMGERAIREAITIKSQKVRCTKENTERKKEIMKLDLGRNTLGTISICIRIR